jgi:hypothetical protein
LIRGMGLIIRFIDPGVNPFSSNELHHRLEELEKHS